jgi:hypothetical protein
MRFVSCRWLGSTATLSLVSRPKTKDEIQERKNKETGFNSLNDDRFELFECHINLDLEGYEDTEDGKETGIEIPYVVTVIGGTGEILSVQT